MVQIFPVNTVTPLDKRHVSMLAGGYILSHLIQTYFITRRAILDIQKVSL